MAGVVAMRGVMRGAAVTFGAKSEQRRFRAVAAAKEEEQEEICLS